jgi:hypothetical protein
MKMCQTTFGLMGSYIEENEKDEEEKKIPEC